MKVLLEILHIVIRFFARAGLRREKTREFEIRGKAQSFDHLETAVHARRAANTRFDDADSLSNDDRYRRNSK